MYLGPSNQRRLYELVLVAEASHRPIQTFARSCVQLQGTPEHRLQRFNSRENFDGANDCLHINGYQHSGPLWPIVAHCGPGTIVRLLFPLKCVANSCVRRSIHRLDEQVYHSFTLALFVNGLSSYQHCRCPHFIFINAHTS